MATFIRLKSFRKPICPSSFLSLKAVYRVDRDEAAERAEKTASSDFTSQVLHLRLVGRNQTKVDALVQDACFADPADIGFQFLQ